MNLPSVIDFVVLGPGVCDLHFCLACRIPVRLYLQGAVEGRCGAGD